MSTLHLNFELDYIYTGFSPLTDKELEIIVADRIFNNDYITDRKPREDGVQVQAIRAYRNGEEILNTEWE